MTTFDEIEAAFPLADDWTWDIGRGRPSTNPADPIHQRAPYRANAHRMLGGRLTFVHGCGDTPEEAAADLLANKP